MSITDNLKTVRDELAQALRNAGREPSEVLLLPVSKTKPEADILELYKAGQRDFGENYVQELKEKHEHLPKDIRWHMIGHLQRNKVKYIAEYVSMIHSVDTRELADTIEKEAAKYDRVISVLLEVNAGGEKSKFGVSPEAAPELASYIFRLPHVKLEGLMTSAPYVEDTEQIRPVFKVMRQLMIDINLKNHNNKMTVLSMGMSNDYRVAAEEGSTCVRIGTSIFGKRDYSKD